MKVLQGDSVCLGGMCVVEGHQIRKEEGKLDHPAGPWRKAELIAQPGFDGVAGKAEILVRF